MITGFAPRVPPRPFASVDRALSARGQPRRRCRLRRRGMLIHRGSRIAEQRTGKRSACPTTEDSNSRHPRNLWLMNPSFEIEPRIARTSPRENSGEF